MAADRVVVVQKCARDCAYVRYLLDEIAQLRGTTAAVQDEEHALDRADTSA